MIAGSISIFFKFIWNMVCFFMCRTIKILISNRPRKLKFSKFLQEGNTCQLLFDFSHQCHALVTLYVQFLCCDWSNLTGEFMQKIYAPINVKPQGGGGGGGATHGKFSERAFHRVGNLTWPPFWKTERNWK